MSGGRKNASWRRGMKEGGGEGGSLKEKEGARKGGKEGGREEGGRTGPSGANIANGQNLDGQIIDKACARQDGDEDCPRSVVLLRQPCKQHPSHVVDRNLIKLAFNRL